MLEQSLAQRPQLELPRLRRLEVVDGFVKGRVSIVMPAYNEADCIIESIARVKQHFAAVCDDYEIIVVDDGSVDGTRNLVEMLTDDKVRLISYEKNEGKGYAFRNGFFQATGEFTFLVDGDAEIMAEDLNSYLEALEKADIVVGSKRHPLSSVRAPFPRRFLSLAFNLVERLLTGVNVTDSQAGFKAIRSRVLYRIIPLTAGKRFAFDVEILAIASLFGCKIRELPVRVDLKSLVSVGRVSRMLLDVLGVAYRIRIRRWYQKNIATLSDTYDPILRI